MTLAERLTQLREDMPRWDTASLSPSRVIEIMNTLPALLDLVEAGAAIRSYHNYEIKQSALESACAAFDAAVKRLEAGR